LIFGSSFDNEIFVPASMAVLEDYSESANFVSLMFCVLDNNIRNFKCVLSGADFTAQELTKSLGLFQAG
jgi:hypothetical protein